MPNTTGNSKAKSSSRREILKLGGFAVAGTAVASLVPSNAQADCCDSTTLPATSVFTTVGNSKSADKYAAGDSPATFRLAALWLLMMTEDWTQNLKAGATEKQFTDGLAQELGLDHTVVEAFWNNARDNSTVYEPFRTFWQNQTADTALYGKRPCIGGKSALQIACLATTAATPAKTKK
jgi:hypothetical protein